MNAIADSGFIAAVFAKSKPKEQQWALRWLQKVSLPLLTSAVNVFEAGWLVGNPEGIMRLVVEGDYKLALDCAAVSALDASAQRVHPVHGVPSTEGSGRLINCTRAEITLPARSDDRSVKEWEQAFATSSGAA